MTELVPARVLRPLADPRWGQAPPGAILELPPTEIEALRLAGLVELMPTDPRPRRTKAASRR